MDRAPRLLLCVTGGIAAYKAPLLVRAFVKRGYEVRCVLTRAALPLVGIDALRTVSGAPVCTDDLPSAFDMDHIRLAEWADVMLIAPATANTIAKIAHGIADTLVTTLALSFRNKIIVAPAMNTAMWEKPVTQANCAALVKCGVFVLPVGVGELACGDDGAGRMINPESIVDFVLCADLPRHLEGKKVLIASGPTQEPLDPVRVLSNRSSGRMGAALAAAATAMGADVTVVCGPSPVPPPEGVAVVNVETAAQMYAALHDRFENSDICIMAAAVADYRPAAVAEQKIGRNAGLTLDLVANPDIAASLASCKSSRQVLCCFSLETDGGEERAREKMVKKGCDLMVYNRADDSLGRSDNTIAILTDTGIEHFETASKSECAGAILRTAARFLAERAQ